MSKEVVAMLWDGITRRAFGVGGGVGDPVLDTPIERGPRRKLKVGLGQKQWTYLKARDQRWTTGS